MITRDTQVVNLAAPDMSLDDFAKVLIEGSSLTADDINKSYQEIVSRGVSPAFCLACFYHESKLGKLGICATYGTKSPGNTRTSILGNGTPIQTAQGQYISYPSWQAGFADLAARLIAPNFVYAKNGLNTIGQILPVFAPITDGNDPVIYVQSVVNLINSWIKGSGTMQDPVNKLDIVHANKGREGASPEIIVLHVQDGTNDLPSFFRSSGDDSTIWCKQDGTLIRMEQDTDSAWTNGYMTEPIDHTNPHIQSLYNRGVRNSNNYSLTIEHQGFSTGAFTDAAIESTAKMCAYWMQKYGWSDVETRIVGHYQIGEHKNCPGPNFPWAKLRARVKDLLVGVTVLTTDNHTNPLPKPDPNKVNGHVLAHGFKDFYDKLAAVSPNFQLLVLGYPLTDEFDCPVNNDGKNFTVQLFERGFLLYESAAPTPWDVRIGTTAQLATVLLTARAKAFI